MRSSSNYKTSVEPGPYGSTKIIKLLRNSLLMPHNTSSSCLKQPTFLPYHKPHEANPYLHILLFRINFIIIPHFAFPLPRMLHVSPT